MPSKTTSWSRPRIVGDTNVVDSSYYNYSSWVISPVTRKIRVDVSNSHELRKGKLTLCNNTGPNPTYCLYGDINSTSGPLGGIDYSSEWSRLQNVAVARFNAKARKGAAALGITVASWRQSKDMIVNRMGRVGRSLDLRTKHLEGNARERKALQSDIQRDLKRGREPAANLILETEFGWRPLVDDLSKALAVATQPIPHSYVKGVAKMKCKDRFTQVSSVNTYESDLRATYGAVVSVTNPNLYLANQLGLINPVGVAWDLIPWSFVVGMFLNVNQMISSLTDEVGLTVRDRSITLTRSTLRHRRVTDPGWPWHGSTYATIGKSRTRSLVSSAPLSWQPKLPNFDWELAVIAASLVTQKFKKLNNLLKI